MKTKRAAKPVHPKSSEVTTFTTEMWDGYGGCTEWDDPTASQPVYREIVSKGQLWCFVADKECVQAHDSHGEVTYDSGSLKFPTQEAAKAFLRGIEDDFDFKKLGFKKF